MSAVILRPEVSSHIVHVDRPGHKLGEERLLGLEEVEDDDAVATSTVNVGDVGTMEVHVGLDG
ncbi:uncharacterized protein ColSpa_07137 [Colletotrichum spaethianum]|uniref:Uncharacterized protein n=1 Tax=Colletotrichum spaethianum TaxID=700344 RepID=A0AA37P6P2_9PEZI|nr:uncharacterized protein ColSpa_07137 [Colletotrichum spaethianum]GKT46956.1 hypothetical protein ColSpa_07137 [Colletotrichum spaethianum]